ncbi:30S ribosomal protein S2 [Candidatus Daviesbacteria bacterium]|nr:30S ribosomal protein S2 [Candidatus Daviesbacteria bacterium]
MIIKTPDMQELLAAGVHFGHKISRGHPKMKRYIFGARDGVHILDLAQSEAQLKEATQAAYELGKSGAVMLLVGTKKQAHEVIEGLAKEADTPYLTEKWAGGFFTNFDELRKNIKKLTELKGEQEKGQLSRYTKREQMLISKKLAKFTNEMGGALDMDKLPEAIFVVDAVADNIAVREAGKMGIKVLGLCDTNADPTWFDWPVSSNDDGIKAIKIICETVIRAYAAGKKEAGIKVGEEKKESKVAKVTEDPKEAVEELPEPLAQEAAAIEEEVEKKVVDENSRKVE